MAAHDSLSSEFVPPPPLRPLRKMGVNDPCWCGSGKKWKKCHKDREKQPSVNIAERINATTEEMVRGVCLHPEASPQNCGKRVIRSHTVQRKGGLTSIAEKSHVISFKQAAFRNIAHNNGKIVPEQVGLRSASTFMGFRDKHDADMFKPIETGTPILSKENVFLLSFRALAYELHAKREAYRSIQIQREIDRGKPFDIQCRIQEGLHAHECGTKIGLDDMERCKSEYDSCYLSSDFTDHSFYGIVFSDILPIVSCGAFYPEFDFNGVPLQRLGRGDMKYHHVTFNLTTLGDKTVAALGVHGHEGKPAKQFVNSLIDLPPIEKADALVRLAFEHIENTYVKPSWWNDLSDIRRSEIIHRLSSGLPSCGRKQNCLSDTSTRYVSSEVVEELAEDWR